ncbi:MAG: biopolymer transporter ExbD [Marinobacter sp.]|nr:biopolymer transporter ExbD [Marinobacter sp.]
MKTSRRARRMQRHYTRMHRAGGLNLVSLMDIFTILVFFLMVNSSDVKVMQNNHDVPLPVSTAKTPAADTLMIQVTGQSILVQGREVVRRDALGEDWDSLPDLARELSYQRKRQAAVPEQGLRVTILAGASTSYQLLHRIMETCVSEDYRQVRLAVDAAPEAHHG